MRPIGNVCYHLQKRSHTATVFFAGGRSSYDWSYEWSRDQQRLEKIDGKIHHIVGNRTTSGSHKRSIVRPIVAPTIDRTINRGILRPIAYNGSEQSIGDTTGRKVARPVWNMTIDLVATDLPLAITHDLCDQSYDLCDQSYILATIGPRFQHFSVAGRS